MAGRTFGGMEVVRALVNVGGFEWGRTTGEHAQLYYERPTNDADRRHVTVPLHDELRTGTLRDVAEGAGANDLQAFCACGSTATPDRVGCKRGRNRKANNRTCHTFPQ